MEEIVKRKRAELILKKNICSLLLNLLIGFSVSLFFAGLVFIVFGDGETIRTAYAVASILISGLLGLVMIHVMVIMTTYEVELDSEK